MLPPHPKPPSRAGKVQGPHPACPHGGILWDKTDCSWLKLLNSSSKRGRFCVWGGRRWHLAAGIVPHLLVTWHWDMGQGCGDRYGWVTWAGAGGAGRKGQSDGEELGTGQREV